MKFKVEYSACNDEAVNERNKKEAEEVIKKFLKSENVAFTYGEVMPSTYAEAMVKAEHGFSRRYVEGEIKENEDD